MPHLHFLVWLRYLETEWNRPTRDNWYAMQIAAEIRQIRNGFSKNPKGVSLNSLKLKFQRPGAGKKMSDHEYHLHELAWRARLGGVGVEGQQGRTGPATSKPRGPGMAGGNPATAGPRKPSQLIQVRKRSKPPRHTDRGGH